MGKGHFMLRCMLQCRTIKHREHTCAFFNCFRIKYTVTGDSGSVLNLNSHERTKINKQLHILTKLIDYKRLLRPLLRGRVM